MQAHFWQRVGFIANRVLRSTTATVTVTASDGTGPKGTATVPAPGMTTLAGGKAGTISAQVLVSTRCIANLSVSGTGTHPDPSNNTTQLVIDVDDKENCWSFNQRDPRDQVSRYDC